jgi:hypothetical protein
MEQRSGVVGNSLQRAWAQAILNCVIFGAGIFIKFSSMQPSSVMSNRWFRNSCCQVGATPADETFGAAPAVSGAFVIEVLRNGEEG